MVILKTAGIFFTILYFSLNSAHAQPDTVPHQGPGSGQQQSGWLGVWVQPVPAPLKSQLGHLTPAGEGLMVAQVESDSPAQKAGIQRFDLLVSFAGQKLFTMEQLTSLVHNFNANSPVDMEIIHQGELIKINATLAAHNKRTLARTHRNTRFFPPWIDDPMHQKPPSQWPQLSDRSTGWEKFESIEVKTLNNGRFRAVVSFKDHANETATFTFEGEKQDIIQQIQALEELPADKKHALLNALNLHPGQNSYMQQFGFGQHGLKHDFFDAPPFQQNMFNQYPFNRPFLRDPYYMNRYLSDPWEYRWYAPRWQMHLYPGISNGMDGE